jgi:hypothetical protein
MTKPLNLHVHDIPAHDPTSFFGCAIHDGQDIEAEMSATPAVQEAVILFLEMMFPLF